MLLTSLSESKIAEMEVKSEICINYFLVWKFVYSFIGCCANIKEKLEDMKEQAEEAAARAADMVTEKLDQAKEQVS